MCTEPALFTLFAAAGRIKTRAMEQCEEKKKKQCQGRGIQSMCR